MKKLPLIALCFSLTACANFPGSGNFLSSNENPICSEARSAVSTMPVTQSLRYGFFSDFNPLSYAATLNEFSSEANDPLGYEPSLIKAVSLFGKGALQFQSIAIPNPFKGIWLDSASTDFDLVGGGITALENRRYVGSDHSSPLITFGVGHVSFRQSLLTRENFEITNYHELNHGHKIGVLAGTTGEVRLLELVGYVDDAGYLSVGSLVGYPLDIKLESHQGDVLSAAVQSQSLAGRVSLSYEERNLPQIIYFNNEFDALLALESGDIDGFARGEIGNQVASVQDEGVELKVAVIDRQQVEYGAFSYPATAEGDLLRGVMDKVISCLTDDNKVGFAQWNTNNEIFSQRANKFR
ncbi:transporter substrate-binding domain-containing protein [Pelagibaculum spongiae]|uniref:Uncharacterized protein n=1 Tax=Pelagibaculum spongiae TaxID=2080658 RepID=A0A2V1H0Y6_9GAMM|nr:transporter substrate-binding domain-containing protein [Pelagibaculum spongiae]PVZ69682.1 hypothetical protein DC094_10295 [Pelagibaculum spongiae]